MKNLISFVSNRPWLNKESNSVPAAIVKTIPDWYRKADRFFKKPDGDFWNMPDGGKMPTWKACPAIFDIMTTGYTLKTPCDIEFIDESGKLSVIIKDKMYQDFCTPRPAMPQFQHPQGYYADHFAWMPDWAIETPKGYSVLYSQPFNRFELPFLTVSGIIDNDSVNLPGSFPFFVVKGFSGVIKAGTPYAQVIPFKRDNWYSEIVIEDSKKMHNKNISNSMKYRVPNGGVYKNKVWQPRKYE